MTRFRKNASFALAVTMIMTMSACDESTSQGISSPASTLPASTTTTGAVTTTDPDENAATDEKIRDVINDEYAPSGNAGTVKFLGYNDIRNRSTEVYSIFTSEQYGGEIEYIATASGDAYFEKLGVLIASGDSPDCTTYEWQSYPYGLKRNLYEPLDEYVSLESPIWEGIAHLAEDFVYEGKHYYYPYQTITNFAINYNRKAVIEAGLTDPYDLYIQNNWTWDTFRGLCVEWCNIDDEKIGYAGTHAMSFVATTGVPLIDVRKDGTILNNIKDPNLARAMQFASTLYRDGLVYQNEFVEWLSPQLWAKNSDRVLFYGMNPDWVYSEAAAAVQNLKGVENDICGVVSDFAFVPFPRDPSSETYTIAYDTFGYMVPKGAKNIEGAIDWIHLNRIYEIDEEVRATARDRAINPEPIYYIEGKYEGMRKWQLVWDPDLYDLWMDMKDPTKFNFVFEDCNGFDSELITAKDKLFGGPLFDGDSWTQLSEEYAPVIEAMINEYR